METQAAAPLTRSTFLLSFVWQADTRAIFSYDPHEDGNPIFWAMEADKWEDMGSPRVVTVTIQPGDLLNG